MRHLLSGSGRVLLIGIPSIISKADREESITVRPGLFLIQKVACKIDLP